MPTVTYRTETYSCTTAIKGTDYVHLLDANNIMIAAWDGVSSFSDFSISGGDWTAPSTLDGCYIAVLGEDGVLRKSGRRCGDVPSHNHDDRYYTESEVNALLADYYTETEVNALLSGKSNTGHTHDDRYYTESEMNTLLNGKASTSHNHDSRYYTESEMDSLLSGKSSTSHTHSGYESRLTALESNPVIYVASVDARSSTITGPTWSQVKAAFDAGKMIIVKARSDTNVYNYALLTQFNNFSSSAAYCIFSQANYRGGGYWKLTYNDAWSFTEYE